LLSTAAARWADGRDTQQGQGVYGAPPKDHHGVLPRRHSSAVWKTHVQDEARRARRRGRGDGRAWRHRSAHGVEANKVTGGAAPLPVPA